MPTDASPPPRWPDRPPHDWPAATPASSAAPTAGGPPAPEPWATWHIVLISVATLLVGFTLGLVAGSRYADDDPDDSPERAASELTPGPRIEIGPPTTEPGAGPLDAPTDGGGRSDASDAPGPPTPSDDPIGSLTNPVPMGVDYLVGSDLVIRVVGVDHDAAGTLGAGTDTTVADGDQSVLVTVELHFDGPSEVLFPANVFFFASDLRGERYLNDGGCGPIPNPVSGITTMRPGDLVQANLCFRAPAGRVDSLVLVAEVTADFPVVYALRG